MIKETIVERIMTLEEYIEETGCTTSAEKFRNTYKVAAVKVNEKRNYSFLSKDEYDDLKKDCID